jgi:hypothetical protein
MNTTYTMRDLVYACLLLSVGVFVTVAVLMGVV